MTWPEHLRDLAARVSNTGRWGPDDQRGTLNLIDTAAVLRGIGAARQGRVFSLAIPFDEDGPQTGQIPGRENPERRMLAVNAAYTGDPDGFCTSDDALSMGVQAATHWDALAHASYGGGLDHAPDAPAGGEAGAARLGIEHYGPVVTRGVLADVARLHGVDHLHGGDAIGGDDPGAARGAAGGAGAAG